jgi:hypothetical protein
VTCSLSPPDLPISLFKSDPTSRSASIFARAIAPSSSSRAPGDPGSMGAPMTTSTRENGHATT